MPRKPSIVRKFEEEQKRKEQELRRKQVQTLKRKKLRPSEPKKRSRKSDSNWNRVRKHVQSLGFMKLQFLQSGKSMMDMEENITRLYEQLEVPNKSLSFYAENILLMTLHKDKSARLKFPDLKLLQNARRPIKGMSVREKHVNFMLAARFGHLERVRKFVDGELVDVNWTFNNGNNVLHECILGNGFGVFDFLLDIPYIDFDYPNAYAVTPLFLAALKRNYFAVFKLVMRGADPDACSRGESLRDLAWGDPKLKIVLNEAERWRPKKNTPVRPSKKHAVNAVRTASLVLHASKKLKGYGKAHGDHPPPRESEIGRAKIQVSNRYGDEHGRRQTRIAMVRKSRILGGDVSGDDSQMSQTIEVSSDYSSVDHDDVLHAMKESDQKFKAVGEANKKRQEKERRLQSSLPIKY